MRTGSYTDVTGLPVYEAKNGQSEPLVADKNEHSNNFTYPLNSKEYNEFLTGSKSSVLGGSL